MPVTLLQSQLATLEPLAPDEAGLLVDIAAPGRQMVIDALAGNPPGQPTWPDLMSRLPQPSWRSCREPEAGWAVLTCGSRGENATNDGRKDPFSDLSPPIQTPIM